MCGVNSFREANEVHSRGLQVIEQQDQVPEVSPKAIQPPDDHVEPAALRIADQVIERRATFLGPADTLIDILLRVVQPLASKMTSPPGV